MTVIHKGGLRGLKMHSMKELEDVMKMEPEELAKWFEDNGCHLCRLAESRNCAWKEISGRIGGRKNMGQYHQPYNLTKKETFSPHGLGDGPQTGWRLPEFHRTGLTADCPTGSPLGIGDSP